MCWWLNQRRTKTGITHGSWWGCSAVSAQLIFGDLLQNLNEDGHMYHYMDKHLDNERINVAISKSEGHVVWKNAQKMKRITSKGYEFLVKKKDIL